MSAEKKLPSLSGVALALAAAGLIAGCSGGGNGSTEVETAAPAAAETSTVELAHCYGVNKCKGHNDCGTANNDCGGHASCKGSGFVAMPVKACGDVGGTVKDEWRGEIASADLIHCNGVNVCKGHNDCGTANNDCAGHASCKGKGFVSTTAKSCNDIGGNIG